MKHFPKKIATKDDLYNCLSLVQNGVLKPNELKQAIKQIENSGYIQCPILETDTERKIIKVRYCAEAVVDVKIGNVTSCRITNVEHVSADDSEEINLSIITISKALTEDDNILLITSPINPFDSIGVTATEITNLKGVLKNYE